jgi:hypothetical protein
MPTPVLTVAASNVDPLVPVILGLRHLRYLWPVPASAPAASAPALPFAAPPVVPCERVTDDPFAERSEAA